MVAHILIAVTLVGPPGPTWASGASLHARRPTGRSALVGYHPARFEG